MLESAEFFFQIGTIRAGRISRVHKPAMMRSEERRLGAPLANCGKSVNSSGCGDQESICPIVVSICRNFRANRIDVLSLCELLDSSCFAFTLDHTSPSLNRPERCRARAQYLFTLISLLSTWTDRPWQRATRFI